MTAAQATRPTQRKRALEATGELVAANGYAQTTVAQITREAGISRAKFYEEFKDKEDCFLAAHAPLADRLGAEVEQAIGERPASEAAQSAIGALVRFAEDEPAAFYVLTHEAMLAGRAGWQARDRLSERLEGAIEAAWTRAGAEDAVPDIPAKMLVGASIRLLGVHMRRGEREHSQLQSGLLEWLQNYEAPSAARRCTALHCHAALCEGDELPAVGPTAPAPLPRGRHRRPAPVAKQIQRERILHASAEVVRAKGHVNVSVSEIVTQAGVSREVFYTHFRDRQEALLAVQSLMFEQVLGACAGPFFRSSISWEERIWESGRIFTTFIVAQPALSQIAFVDTYALGPEGLQRADDSIAAFSIFLEQGRSQEPGAKSVPSLVGAALFTSIIEVIVYYICNGRAEELPGLLPVVSYVIFAPLIGREAANGFVGGRVEAGDGLIEGPAG
jgi:AcrR family transcriptional regulator